MIYITPENLHNESLTALAEKIVEEIFKDDSYKDNRYKKELYFAENDYNDELPSDFYSILGKKLSAKAASQSSILPIEYIDFNLLSLNKQIAFCSNLNNVKFPTSLELRYFNSQALTYLLDNNEFNSTIKVYEFGSPDARTDIISAAKEHLTTSLILDNCGDLEKELSQVLNENRAIKEHLTPSGILRFATSNLPDRKDNVVEYLNKNWAKYFKPNDALDTKQPCVEQLSTQLFPDGSKIKISFGLTLDEVSPSEEDYLHDVQLIKIEENESNYS